MKACVIILLAIFLIGVMDTVTMVQAGDIDLACTIGCSGYWLCVWKSQPDCKKPANCICEKPAFGV